MFSGTIDIDLAEHVEGDVVLLDKVFDLSLVAWLLKVELNMVIIAYNPVTFEDYEMAIRILFSLGELIKKRSKA